MAIIDYWDVPVVYPSPAVSPSPSQPPLTVDIYLSPRCPSVSFRYRANSPGYRKKNYYDNDGNRVHEEHPRGTVRWKQKGIRHDTKNNRVRLSKGANHKDHPRNWDYILVEHETRPEATVENLQQVRAVYRQSRSSALGSSPEAVHLYDLSHGFSPREQVVKYLGDKPRGTRPVPPVDDKP